MRAYVKTRKLIYIFSTYYPICHFVCAGPLPPWKLMLRGSSTVHLATAGAVSACLGSLPTLGVTSTDQVTCSGTVSWRTTGTDPHRTTQVKNRFPLQSASIIRTLSRTALFNTCLWLLEFSHIIHWRWRLQLRTCVEMEQLQYTM
jgi:hypothetical protein